MQYNEPDTILAARPTSYLGIARKHYVPVTIDPRRIEIETMYEADGEHVRYVSETFALVSLSCSFHVS